MNAIHAADHQHGVTWEMDGRTFRLIQGPRSYRSRIASLPTLRHKDIAASFKPGYRQASVTNALTGEGTCSWPLLCHIHDCVVAAEEEAGK